MSDLVRRNNAVSISGNRNGMSIVPETFAQVMEFAAAMSVANVAIPKHLRGSEGACMAVAMQAFEWGMSPFAVANKSYSVNDRIAYEAQLIAAVVNTRSGIQGRLKYKYSGDGDTRRCTVIGILDGEEAEYTSPLFSKITPKNSPLWKSDPDQQLAYYSARAWARRHVPEVILGVYDREEIETIDSDPIDYDPPQAPKAEAVIEHKPEPKPKATKKPKDEPKPETEQKPVEEAQTEDNQAIAGYDSTSDFLSALDEAMTLTSDEETLEEVWNDFDPMATLQAHEGFQETANTIKERHLKRIEASNNPPSAGLFRDE